MLHPVGARAIFITHSFESVPGLFSQPGFHRRHGASSTRSSTTTDFGRSYVLRRHRPPKNNLRCCALLLKKRMEPVGNPSKPETTPPPSPDRRDWSELPLDALVLVFARLGPIEILMGSGLVCHSWVHAAKEDPSLWSSLDMTNHMAIEAKPSAVLRKMAMVAVDRSKGRLESFSAKYFVTDDLLKYISSSSLRSLSLASCNEVTNKGFTELVTRSPRLENLELELCPNVGGRHAFQAAGRACRNLRRFSLRRECFRFSLNYSRRTAEALGIAAAMSELRCLTLVSCNINNDELVAVVEGCPRLEMLCLRDCYKVIADGSLRAKCAAIRTLTLADSRV